ncbi:MAG: hypothetical protein MR393_11990, partial [Intestinimonas massiliensis]|uniref:hypothetical protein n=1 Tax=Intestinimonas massiliensis (ex Afouda et al. 2020) TaxID=1673721 RepID=UPI00242C8610
MQFTGFGSDGGFIFKLVIQDVLPCSFPNFSLGPLFGIPSLQLYHLKAMVVKVFLFISTFYPIFS